MLIFVFFGLSLAISCSLATKKEELLPCITKADLDHNNQLNSTEITNFISLHHLEKISNLKYILDLCDLDKDGTLTMNDFNNTRSCVNPYILCIYCETLNLNK